MSYVIPRHTHETQLTTTQDLNSIKLCTKTMEVRGSKYFCSEQHAMGVPSAWEFGEFVTTRHCTKLARDERYAGPKTHGVRTVIISSFRFHVNLKMSRIWNWTIFYRVWSRFIPSEKPILLEEPEGLRQDWTLSDATLWTALILVTTKVQTDARMNEMNERRTGTWCHFHLYAKRAQIYLNPPAKKNVRLNTRVSSHPQPLIRWQCHHFRELSALKFGHMG
jgi:hypothetical protein